MLNKAISFLDLTAKLFLTFICLFVSSHLFFYFVNRNHIGAIDIFAFVGLFYVMARFVINVWKLESK